MCLLIANTDGDSPPHTSLLSFVPESMFFLRQEETDAEKFGIAGEGIFLEKKIPGI